MFADSDDETDEKMREDKNSTKKISDDKNNQEKKTIPKVVQPNTGDTDFNNKTTKRIDELSNAKDDKIVMSKGSDLIKFSISEVLLFLFTYFRFLFCVFIYFCYIYCLNISAGRMPKVTNEEIIVPRNKS